MIKYIVIGLVVLLLIFLGTAEYPDILADAEPLNGTYIEYPKDVVDLSKIPATCVGTLEECVEEGIYEKSITNGK